MVLFLLKHPFVELIHSLVQQRLLDLGQTAWPWSDCQFITLEFCVVTTGATKDMGKMLGGEEEKDPDAEKKEEERQEALRQQEEERKAKYAKMEAEREGVRQGIRDKVGHRTQPRPQHHNTTTENP